MEQHRRETDKLSSKLQQWSGMILAVGAIGTAILFVGSLFFQTVKQAEACETKTQEKIITIEQKQIETDKTLVKINSNLEYLKEGVSEIKKKLK